MSQISAFDPTAEALRSTTPNGFSSMKSEDFIRVIFAELANQDPFQPSDSAALLEQLSSIRSIESDLELTDQLNALVLENQLASASNLIGKMVGGLTTTNDRVAGTVVSVIRQGDQVTLELDTGWLMPIESVEQIIDLPPQDP
ncbi:MAG: flagellar hook capping FlgD N-terminal domain-containing protein [Planctomycetota bacterium]|jgi:flagellar basal-body rod modification protein FlgD